MKYAIIGSRTFNAYTYMVGVLQNLDDIDEIISGGAVGADAWAAFYASQNKIPLTVLRPDWSVGKHAGFLRNAEIIEACDKVLAFWDGKSRGTAHSIGLAEKAGKPVSIFWPEAT
jgi:hypothetical protein